MLNAANDKAAKAVPEEFPKLATALKRDLQIPYLHEGYIGPDGAWAIYRMTVKADKAHFDLINASGNKVKLARRDFARIASNIVEGDHGPIYRLADELGDIENAVAPYDNLSTAAEMDKARKAAIAARKQVLENLTDYCDEHCQYSRVEVAVDIFRRPEDGVGIRWLRDNGLRYDFPHNPFRVSTVVDAEKAAEFLADYKEHFPQFDAFLDHIVDCRFAGNRKTSFFWLHCPSDWGKSFLLKVVLGKPGLDMVCNINPKEIERAAEGAPIGKTEAEFVGKWILFADEFKTVKAELKEITHQISAAPKFNMQFTADVYLKVFASAETVPALTGEEGGGVEGQFANRFNIWELEGNLDKRSIFKANSKEYTEAVTAYAAERINRRVEDYRGKGRVEASRVADGRMGEFHRAYGLANTYEGIEVGIGDLSEFIRQQVRGYVSAMADTSGKPLSERLRIYGVDSKMADKMASILRIGVDSDGNAVAHISAPVGLASAAISVRVEPSSSHLMGVRKSEIVVEANDHEAAVRKFNGDKPKASFQMWLNPLLEVQAVASLRTLSVDKAGSIGGIFVKLPSIDLASDEPM